MFNTTKKRIALIGSAPASINLAPYGHPEWHLVGCSPGAFGVAGKHAHDWFEIHRFEPQIPGFAGTGKAWFSPEYVEWMTRRTTGNIWMADPLPKEIPTATALPIAKLIDKYGPFFFTSSLSYMFAMALETPGVEEIGMWGVDMSANEEYSLQRPGCQYFITLAIQRGIKVTIPPESDILQPPFMYGVTENSPMAIKLTARRQELIARHQQAVQQKLASERMEQYFAGALDDINYMWNTWLTTQSFVTPTMGATGNETRRQQSLSDGDLTADYLSTIALSTGSLSINDLNAGAKWQIGPGGSIKGEDAVEALNRLDLNRINYGEASAEGHVKS